jgi:hypothetical protein
MRLARPIAPTENLSLDVKRNGCARDDPKFLGFSELNS